MKHFLKENFNNELVTSLRKNSPEQKDKERYAYKKNKGNSLAGNNYLFLKIHATSQILTSLKQSKIINTIFLIKKLTLYTEHDSLKNRYMYLL